MYDEIFELIQNGELNKAQEQLENTPENDPKRYNISGLIYYQKKEFDKAKEEFEKGLKINPVDSDLLFNYGYLLKNINQEKEAWRYLMRIHNKDWATYDLLGDIEYKNRSKLASLRFYKKAAELPNSPNEMKKKFIDMRNIVKQDTKIAFLCLPGLDNFLKDIVETFSLGYDVKLVVTTDGNQIAESIKWADIVWLEWANEMAVFATNQIPEIQNKKVVCRLHGYEAFNENVLNKINWNFIDRMIFVADHVREDAFESCSKIKNIPYTMVYNGIDLDKITYNRRTKGKKICFSGYINYKKNPMLMLQILSKLLKIDPEYKVYWVGKHQDIRIAKYMNYILKDLKIEDNFVFEGWTSNINSWLEDKNYFLSTSIHEGYGVAIMEAMAKGIKPIIHNFYAARGYYPDDLIYNTIDEAVEKITEQTYDSENYRRFIEDKYSLEEQVYEAEKIVTQQKSKSKANHIFSFDYNNKKIYFYLPFLSDHIQKAIYLNKNFYEVHMLEDTKNRIRKNAVIVDVGANIGNHTIFYAKICQAKKVYSFEPQSEIFDILTKNIKLNNVNNTVVPYKMGVGKEHSFGYIDVIDSYNFGSSRIVNLNNQKGEIEIDSLDSLIFNFEEKIDLIKIDVEGMEMDVLLGAEKIIQQYKPLIYIEAKENKEFDEINFFLRNFNYKPIKKFNYTPTYLFINE